MMSKILKMICLLGLSLQIYSQENGSVENELNAFMTSATSMFMINVFHDSITHYNDTVRLNPQMLLNAISDDTQKRVFQTIYGDIKELPEILIDGNQGYLKTKDVKVIFTPEGMLTKKISINGEEFSYEGLKSVSDIASALYLFLQKQHEIKPSIAKKILEFFIPTLYALPIIVPPDSTRTDCYGHPCWGLLPWAKPNGNPTDLLHLTPGPNMAGLQRYQDNTNRNRADFEIMRMVLLPLLPRNTAYDIRLAPTVEAETEIVRSNIGLLAGALRTKRDDCQRDLATMRAHPNYRANEFESIGALTTMLNRRVYKGADDYDRIELQQYLTDAFRNTAPWCRENTTDYYAGHSLYLTYGRAWHIDVCVPFLALKACLEEARQRGTFSDDPLWAPRPLYPMLPPLVRETATLPAE